MSDEVTISRDLLARYHAEAVSALPEDEVEKFRIRLGANLFAPFVESLGEEPLPLSEVKERLERYLLDELHMADSAVVKTEGDELTVEIRGCHICHGNDLLRARGRQGVCPFAPGMNRALAKALGGSARLQGVDKAKGVTGECNIKYSV